MAITIDWGNKVINIPRDDMTLVQAAPPVEVRELNLNEFRLALKSLEDGEEGMCFPDTHRHNTEVSVAGLVLARVIEIINGYTITFEDGQYAVNLVGANSNVADCVNANQVSIRSQNSAGLITNSLIEHSSYQNCVTINTTSPYAGVIHPVGTDQRPVNNLADALLIAQQKGFDTLHLQHDLTLDASIDGYTVTGENRSISLFLQPGFTSNGCSFRDLKLTGAANGSEMSIERCDLENVSGIQGLILDCSLAGQVVLKGSNTNIIDSYSGRRLGLNRTVIDMDSEPKNLQVRRFSGGIKLVNFAFPGKRVVMDFDSGVLEIDPSCTAGELVVRGVGVIIDNGGPNLVRDFEMVNPFSVSEQTRVELSTELTEISDIFKIHGLDPEFPLHVSSIERTAGGTYIVQLIETAPEGTRVTRTI